MAKTPTTIIDLARLSLAHGEGARLDLPVHLDPLELGGQTYVPQGGELKTRIDVSRPSNGYAFRLRFPVRIEGPCMRCLEDAAVETEVDAREVDQSDTDDEELRSPYVVDDQLDLGRWAHDAAVLAIPSRILCRLDCAGLCPACGESLNDADPEDHKHDSGGEPRWSKPREQTQDGPEAPVCEGGGVPPGQRRPVFRPTGVRRPPCSASGEKPSNREGHPVPRPLPCRSHGGPEEENFPHSPGQASRQPQGRQGQVEPVPALSQPAIAAPRVPDLRHLQGS
jgi:uncharacterized protein